MTQTCPRRVNEFGPWDRTEGLDGFCGEEADRPRSHTCTFCGSLNPDVLMQHLEARTATLTPTDKDYKVYVETVEPHADEVRCDSMANHEPSGRGGYKRYGDLSEEEKAIVAASGWTLERRDDEWCHFSKRGATRHQKFYFQHFSRDQRMRFVELLNEKRLRIEGGRFYVLPFFCVREVAAP